MPEKDSLSDSDEHVANSCSWGRVFQVASIENEGTKAVPGTSTMVGYCALVQYVVSMHGALVPSPAPGVKFKSHPVN